MPKLLGIWGEKVNERKLVSSLNMYSEATRLFPHKTSLNSRKPHSNLWGTKMLRAFIFLSLQIFICIQNVLWNLMLIQRLCEWEIV